MMTVDATVTSIKTHTENCDMGLHARFIFMDIKNDVNPINQREEIIRIGEDILVRLLQAHYTTGGQG
jgi:hypothetical protein